MRQQPQKAEYNNINNITSAEKLDSILGAVMNNMREAVADLLLEELYKKNIFCDFAIVSTSDLVEYFVSSFSSRQRMEIYLTQSSESGETPLHRAVCQGDLQTLKFILSSLESNEEYCYKVVKAQDKRGNSALHMCEDVAMADAMLNTLPPMFSCKVLCIYNVDRQTAVHCAILSNNTKLLEVLLKYLPDPSHAIKALSKQSREGLTTIACVANADFNQRFKQITLLCDILTSTDLFILLKKKDKKGDTALHHMLRLDTNETVIAKMMEGLCNDNQIELMDSSGSNGYTPLDLARSHVDAGPAFKWIVSQYAKLQTERVLSEPELHSE